MYTNTTRTNLPKGAEKACLAAGSYYSWLAKYDEDPIVLNTLLPKSVAGLACNYPLFFQGIMMITLIIYVLQMGFGAIALMITLMAYSLLVIIANGTLCRESKAGSFIGYLLSAVVKNGFTAIMLFTSVNGNDMVDTRVLYSVYVGLCSGL